MNYTKELVKTSLFLVVAVVFGGLAVAYAPKLRIDEDAPSDIGEYFFSFEPDEVTQLYIVKTNEETGTQSPLRVEKVTDKSDPNYGLWLIRRTRSDYPTDAENKLGEATATIRFLRKGTLASDKKRDYELYGVNDFEEVKSGARGVGTKVTVSKGKEAVASIIIGKEDPKNDAFRFVREAGRPEIYRAKVDMETLSTKFEDWIETDLLKLNRFDIASVVIDAYKADLFRSPQGMPVLQRTPGEKFRLDYDDAESNWSVAEWQFTNEQNPAEGKWNDEPLGENEELNKDKIREMANSLDDLKIVDVLKKPDWLGEELRVKKEFQDDQEKFQAMVKKFQELAQRGFYLASEAGEIVSNQGDIVVRTKNGVEYNLRFGEIAGQGDEGSQQRFLMVSAKFNQNLLGAPPVNPEEAEQEKPEGDKQDAADDKEKADTKQDGDKSADDAAKKDANKDADAKGDADKKADDADAKDAEKDLDKQRAKQEYERKLAEYNDKVEEGKKEAKQLNDRFANWYYIISEDVYKKIRLTRSDIVKEKPMEEKTDAADGTGDAAAPKKAAPPKKK